VDEIPDEVRRFLNELSSFARAKVD